MQPSEAIPASDVISRLRARLARHPGDLDAGLMLGSTLYQAGDLAGSASVFRSLLRQHPEHGQALLLLARTEARAGERVTALRILTRARQVDPENDQVWRMAAALASDIRDWCELLRIGRDWSRAHPDSQEAWQALSRAHFEESRFSEAIAAYTQLLELAPGNPSYLIGAARLAIAARQYEQARNYLEAAQKIRPDSAELHYTQGRLYHLTGELDAAEELYRQVIDASPTFAAAYVELGTLHEGRLADADLQAVRNLFVNPQVHPEYRVMLGYTLGDALDRRNECAQAFAAWEKANDINQGISEQEGIIYQPELIENEPELLTRLFAEPLKHSDGPSDGDNPRPIFVVGMPRSGTTLVESILASHSDVYGAGELPALYDIHEELMTVLRNEGLEAARELLRVETVTWRQRYLAALPHTGQETSVVDKQPLNYRSIGLIRLLFPDSPIVCTQRSPMDVGLSVYRHKFSKHWPCAHNLKDIGHFYGVHVRVVDLWKKRYPDAIHCLDHGCLVNDPQSEISRLMAFTGLSPQPACFQPHQTKRAIATFSSVQVRQPLSADFTGRSRLYASQLKPLREALKRSGIDVDTGQRVAGPDSETKCVSGNA